MSIYNKDQTIRKFKRAINLIKEKGMDVNIENYESLRGSIFELPNIHNLIKNHPEYGSSFEELVNYEIPSVGELYKE